MVLKLKMLSFLFFSVFWGVWCFGVFSFFWGAAGAGVIVLVLFCFLRAKNPLLAGVGAAAVKFCISPTSWP